MKSFLVTGGAGFIGSCLVWKLNQMGYNNITISDEMGEGNKWKNLYGLKFVDIVNREEAFDGHYDCLIHLGANTDTTEVKNDSIFKNNFHYSKALIDWHVRRDSRVIYASSASTYGDGSKGFSDETNPLDLRPMNMYGMSKNLFDIWIQENGLKNKVASLKYFNVFGPNEYHKGFMTSFIYKIFKNYKLYNNTIQLYKSNDPDQFGDGDQVRDFVYVKDAISATIFFIENPNVNGIFNVGTGVGTSWNVLVDTVSEVLGIKLKKEYIFPKPVSVYDTYQNYTKADISKLRSNGYNIEMTSLKNAISDYINNYLKSNKTIGQ